MFLTLMTCLMFDVANCQLQADAPHYSSSVFKNIGIKLCQLKCVENGFCRSVEYTIPTLTCHLSEMDHDTITNESHHFVGSKDLADVRCGSCQLKTCPNMRCLETRTGRTECVKDKWKHSELNATLLDACKVGDLARIKYLLSDGRANINFVGKDNMTPVIHAAAAGHRDVFYLLVREGANLSVADYRNRNILFFACIGGNLEIVKHVLAQNIVSINSRDMDRQTPAMNAVLYKRKDVFDFLVGAGADLSLVDDFEQTILHVACKGGNVQIVKYLLKLPILDIDNRDINGWTPVMQAASNGHKDVFDILVEAGADLSQLTNDAKTILHLACGGGNVEILKYLLKHDSVDIDSRDVNGWTPVMHAGNAGHKDIFTFLVEKGADLFLVNNNKETILHVLCYRATVQIIKYLLKLGIMDIDSRDINGWTPVMRAASVGRKDVFDVLVGAGANLSFVNNNNETILHVSCEKNNVEIIKYLLTHEIVDIDSRDRFGWTSVMRAASVGRKDVFDVLVGAGANLSFVSNNNETILHVSCRKNNVEIIQYLLTHEIVDIDSRDRYGWTPVMQAAIEGYEDALATFVEWEADLSLLDKDNDNILHLACYHDSVKIVKKLLTNKLVDINSRDGDDCTSAMIAAREGYEAVFNLLVQNEADLTIINDAGDNILNLACEGGNVNIVKYVSTRHIVEGPYREDDPC